MTEIANIHSGIAAAAAAEQVDVLLCAPGVRIERIVSHGHATPPSEVYDQPGDEWVMVVTGTARLWREGAGEVALGAGDHLLIPAHQRHRVTWTTPDAPTLWLAIHLAPATDQSSSGQ